MKIALVGASGQAGSRILAELVRRGHHVTAIGRNPGAVAAGPLVTPVKGDANDMSGLAALLRGHDAVVTSVRFIDSDPQVLIGAVRASGVKRYFIVDRLLQQTLFSKKLYNSTFVSVDLSIIFLFLYRSNF